jgi:hypothetical protein
VAEWNDRNRVRAGLFKNAEHFRSAHSLSIQDGWGQISHDATEEGHLLAQIRGFPPDGVSHFFGQGVAFHSRWWTECFVIFDREFAKDFVQICFQSK